ncbi:MAG TPA: IS66 family transposase, partial [Herpetosiphonaceae bacterium]|nr:IS66 family transposase [Herpetosiphonaceae bacterium]
CWHCQRWHTPRLDLRGQVLGQRRFGVRLTSLVAYLRTTLRLPIGQIRTYLASIHHLRLSAGTIVALLHAATQQGAEAVRALQAGIRTSPVVHADETGWRERGQNGYIWSFSTSGPQAIRYYTYDRSRSGQVARRVLGRSFHGHLVTDFYAGYNQMTGRQQRCWAHLLRDLHTLKEKHGQTVAVRRWTVQVGALYQVAQQRLRQTPALTPVQRQAFYARLVERSAALGREYARVRKHPCQALAKRLLRHQDEPFQFVLVEGLSADNNAAERSLRPLVVGRKISGGSRSAAGSATRMSLASLFGTWVARDLNPFEECLRMLSAQTPLPQL